MKKATLLSTILVIGLLLAACSAPVESVQSQAAQALREVSNMLEPEAAVQDENQQPQLQQPVPSATPGAAVVQLPAESAGLLNAYQGALSQIYESVNPSVVSIRVLSKASGVSFNLPQDGNGGIPGLPFDFDPFGTDPNQGQQAPQTPQYGVGQGSGFVWDANGHIVTNNHVIDGAEKIEVTFSDGTTVAAELVGKDADSDIAVLKVSMPAGSLQPVQLADSSQVKVGELAIAIGNPFGLENSMTIGVISAVGRTMPASEATMNGPSYSIPDVIQTDAPINPGNSGGVLVDDQGRVVGITYMIESPTQANAGIGFVIPSSIVGRVVPTLIQNGSYEHPYLGISGMDLTPSLAEAMDLDSLQRGVLVGDLTSGGPADKAGLQASEKTAAVEGQQVAVGGDVITGIEGTIVTGMDDLISYLASSTTVGQKVSLTVLRDRKQTQVEVTLEARPATIAAQAPANNNNPPETPRQASGRPWLGVTAGSLTPAIAKAMDLPSDQSGVVIEQVASGSPAEEAGLRGSDKASTVDGQPVIIGGDVIIAIGNDRVTSMEDLGTLLQSYQPGDSVTITILRDGKQLEVELTLGERPTG